MVSSMFYVAAWLVFPPAASLVVAGWFRERSQWAGLKYPWFLPRVLVWVLYLTITNGVLTATLGVAVAFSDGSGASLSTISALNLMTLILTAPSVVGVWVGWWLLPLMMWVKSSPKLRRRRS